MSRPAFYTFGILLEEYSHPAMNSFFDQAGLAFGETSRFDGFVGNVGNVLPPKPETLAPALLPKELRGLKDVYTLTLWRDLESVYAFAYHGPAHAEALRRRKEWIFRDGWSTYVAWWIPEDAIPSWEDAIQRYDSLPEHGSTPYAFDFKHAFGPDGQPVQIDRERVEEIRKLVRA